MMRAEHLSLKQGSGAKPNEDCAWVDDSLGIYLVADGVSSTTVAGVYPEPSVALGYAVFSE